MSVLESGAGPRPGAGERRLGLLVQSDCEGEGSHLCPWEKWQIISPGPGVNGSHTPPRPTFPFQFSAQQSWCMWRITWQEQSPPQLAPASCYSLVRVPLRPCAWACVCEYECVCVLFSDITNLQNSKATSRDKKKSLDALQGLHITWHQAAVKSWLIFRVSAVTRWDLDLSHVCLWRLFGLLLLWVLMFTRITEFCSEKTRLERKFSLKPSSRRKEKKWNAWWNGKNQRMSFISHSESQHRWILPK